MVYGHVIVRPLLISLNSMCLSIATTNIYSMQIIRLKYVFVDSVWNDIFTLPALPHPPPQPVYIIIITATTAAAASASAATPAKSTEQKRLASVNACQQQQ